MSTIVGSAETRADMAMTVAVAIAQIRKPTQKTAADVVTHVRRGKTAATVIARRRLVLVLRAVTKTSMCFKTVRILKV
jgi:hypothetical protein